MNRLEFNYPDRQSFALEKNNESWSFQDGKIADSATVVKYINGIISLRGNEFTDKQPIDEDKVAQLTITYDKLKKAEVIIYMPDTSVAFIYSSLNPTNHFIDSDKKIKEKLFVGADYFTDDK